MARLRDRAKQGWHWGVVLTCLVGALIAGRLGLATWNTAGQELQGGAWIWYALTVFLAIAALALLAEAVRRLIRGWR